MGIKMNSASRNFVMGLTVVVAAISLSLLLAEIGLRMFTQFPVSYRTNRIHDSSFGYRLNPGLDDVDREGFRNPDSNVPSGIIAVGDSFTFGNNVDSKDSWPAVLSADTGREVYNTGVGSYGIASYHAVLAKYLSEDSKRKAIVAIYTGNDFLPVNSFCEIDFKDEFWMKEEQRIGSDFASIQKECIPEDNVDISWSKWLKGNIAITNAIDHLITARFSRRSQLQSLPAGLPEVDLLQGAADERTRNAEPHFMRQSMKVFADWGTTWKGRVAIVIIPGKLRVFYEIIVRDDAVAQAPAELLRKAKHEIGLEDFVEAQAGLNGIPIESALTDIVPKVNKELYPVFDVHPYEIGYIAYAQAAKRALETLSK